MTCPHGFTRNVWTACPSCYEENPDGEFWGTCDHGVSLAPTAHCRQCEVREDDFDA